MPIRWNELYFLRDPFLAFNAGFAQVVIQLQVKPEFRTRTEVLSQTQYEEQCRDGRARCLRCGLLARGYPSQACAG
jgi:hypothetical protein